MGYSEEQAASALRVAVGILDRAVDILYRHDIQVKYQNAALTPGSLQYSSNHVFKMHYYIPLTIRRASVFACLWSGNERGMENTRTVPGFDLYLRPHFRHSQPGGAGVREIDAV